MTYDSNRQPHTGAVTGAVPSTQEVGKTHFTDDEIHDIVELGEVLRRVRTRLIAQGKWPDKKYAK